MPHCFLLRGAGAVVGVWIVFLIQVMLTAAPASAHVRVDMVAPGDNARLAASPDSLEFAFSEPVDVDELDVQLLGANGVERALGEPRDAGGTVTEVPVRGVLPEASYLVVVRAAGWDGHPGEYRFAFVVGDGPLTSASGLPVGDTGSPASVTLPLRLADLLTQVGVVLLAGTFVLLLCWKEGLALPVVGRLTVVGAACVIVGALGSLALHGAYVAGAGPAAAAEAVTATLATSFGRLTVLRLVAVSVWAGLALRLQRQVRRDPTVVRAGLENAALLAGVVVVLTLAATSHAASGSLGLALAMVHVAAVSLWLGGVAVLAWVRPRRVPGAAWVRFRRVAVPSVITAVCTGPVLAVVLLAGSPGAAADSAYLRMMAVKVLAIAVLLSVAVNVSRLVSLTGQEATAGRALFVEVGLGVIAIGVASSLAWTPV